LQPEEEWWSFKPRDWLMSSRNVGHARKNFATLLFCLTVFFLCRTVRRDCATKCIGETTILCWLGRERYVLYSGCVWKNYDCVKKKTCKQLRFVTARWPTPFWQNHEFFLSADSWDTGPNRTNARSFPVCTIHSKLNFRKLVWNCLVSSTMASKLADNKIDSMLMKLPDETGKGGNT